MSDTSNSALTGCGLIALSFAMTIVTPMIDAWPLGLAWEAFAVPLGAPAWSYWQLVGLVFVLRIAAPWVYAMPRKNEAPIDWPVALLARYVVGPISVVVAVLVLRGFIG